MLRFSFLLFFLLSTFLTADTLSNAMWGYSFKSPAGWVHQQDGSGAVLGHNTVAGMILVYPHELKSMAALKQEMRKGLDEDEGYLHLKGKLKKSGKNGYVGNYAGLYQNQKVKAKGYGTLAPHGGGAIIIAMSTPQAYSKQLLSAAQSIRRSLQYPKSSSNLKQRFVGKWQTWSKYSESTVYLYPDGTYSDNSSSSYGNADASVGAVWGSANESGGSGHWSVRGSATHGQLTFTNANGESGSYEYRVHVLNGETYWNEYYFGNTLYKRSPLY